MSAAQTVKHFERLQAKVDAAQAEFMNALRRTDDDDLKFVLANLVAARKALDSQLREWAESDD